MTPRAADMSVGFRYTSGDLTSNLTQLYTETKKSALSNAAKDTPDETTPALTSLHRKFRIQKDRLITWGLEWSDEGKGPDGNIDGSVARAGLTETVTSVLENIKEVLEQAERIRSASTPVRSPAWPNLSLPEKSSLLPVDIPRYRDLVTDLTTSIDILYDLSRTRRALVAGSHPLFSTDGGRPQDDEKARLFERLACDQTLVANQSGKSCTSSPLVGLPPIIDLAALILPEEGPPPYANAGVPVTTRLVGRLLRAHCPDEVRFALQESLDDPLVLVEYANFDPLYRERNIPPPLSRLEMLSNYLQQAKVRPQLNLLGYFEDPKEPRLGLIFDLSECSIDYDDNSAEVEPVETFSLLHILQNSSKSAKMHDSLSATPSLEDRFKLAFRVAERAQDVHANEHVHGNLNSGSILFVRLGEKEKQHSVSLKLPVLSSFDLFSKQRLDNVIPLVSIYHHPNDRDHQFDRITAMKYDIYGLGLALLEIGLWSPLNELHKPKYNSADFKMRLERIWVPRLASKCGTLFMSAVQACFALADSQQTTLSQTLRLYESILTKLRRCCLLCDEKSFVDSPRRSIIIPAIDESVTQPTTTYTERASTPIQSDPKHEGHRIVNSPSRPSVDGKPPRSMPKLPPSSLSGNATIDLESIREGVSAAAANIQQAWTENRGVITNPFREYRRRVILVQNQWRRQQQRRASVVDVETSNLAELHHPPTAPVDAGTAATPSAIPRRPVGAPPKPRTFPVNLPPQHLAQWHTDLGLRISRIVERALKNSLESSTIDLVGLGPDEQSAKPTILVTCTSTAQVKAAIKKRFRCDTNIFDVKVRKGTVSLSRRNGKSVKDGLPNAGGEVNQRVLRSQARPGHDADDEEPEPQNPHYHPRPSCGASIGAYNPDEGHLLPVSLGGIITVDGARYGMSVHHMLEHSDDEEDEGSDANLDDGDNSDTESGVQSSAFDSDLDDNDGDDESVPDLVPAGSATSIPRSSKATARTRSRGPLRSSTRDTRTTTRQQSRRRRSSAVSPRKLRSPSPSLSDSSYVSFDTTASADSSDFDSDPDEPVANQPGPIASEGDTRGFQVTAPSTSSWRITQPALLDACATGWHPLDQNQLDTDEDHLASFDLGRLHASSGLRRYRDDVGALHEIDWAIFSIKQERQQSANLVLGGRRYLRQAYKPSYQPKLESPVLRNPVDDLLGTSAVGVSSDDDGRAKVEREILVQAMQFPPGQDLFPNTIVDPADVAGKQVLCSGRTSGLATGRIGGASSFVKIYGRRTFSISWTVIGSFGMGGDSGAWIVDCELGRVCGSVLAEKRGVTYFAPMSMLLDDIRRTLGAQKVELLEQRQISEEVVTGVVESLTGVTIEDSADAVPARRAKTGDEEVPLQSRAREFRLKRKRVNSPRQYLLQRGQVALS